MTGDDAPIDVADIDKYIITSVCEEETIKAYDRSKKGLAIRRLDAQREEAENALYSGGSMQAVRQYINSVFNQAGIADNVAKKFVIVISEVNRYAPIFVWGLPQQKGTCESK